MADNTTLNTGTGGDVIATDDIAGVKHQRVKIQYGVDGSATDVSDTNPLPIDDAGGSLTVDNAHLTTLGGAVSGTEVQVDVVGSLPAGTNAIGKLAANSGVDIGDVDVTSLDGVAAEAAALGNGILIQGDDGTDRKNINVDATTGDVQVDVTNTVNVADGGGSLTVDGTVTADAGTGPWPVTDNGGSLTVDNGGVFATQEDGAALTALQLIDDAIFADDAAFTLASSKVAMAGAVRDDALSTLTAVEGDAVPLRVSSTGALHVTGGGGGTEYTEDSATPATITGTATLIERDDVLSTVTPIEGDWIGLRGTAEGALWTQDFNSDAILADTTAIKTAVETIDNAISGTEMQVDVVAPLPAGTNAIGKLAANSGVDIGDVDVTSIAAGSNLVGDVGISGARTSGGTTLYKNIDVDETEDQVKGTAGQVYWIHAINLKATPLYLKFYNATAASVTVGTTTPDLTFPVPSQGDTNGAGFVLAIPNGIAFSTAITIAATTGVADADTGAPGANELIVNMGYA